MSLLPCPHFLSISLDRRDDRFGHGYDRLEIRPFLGLFTGIAFIRPLTGYFCNRLISSNNSRSDFLSRDRDWIGFFLVDGFPGLVVLLDRLVAGGGAGLALGARVPDGGRGRRDGGGG